MSATKEPQPPATKSPAPEYGQMPVSGAGPAPEATHGSARAGAARYGQVPTSKPLPWVRALPRADFAALFRGTAARLGARDDEIDLALRQMGVE